MALVPEYQAMFDQLAAEPAPPLSALSPAEGRDLYRAMRPLNPDLEVGAVENRTIEGPADTMGLRIYRPAGSTTAPVYIHYHGGGWVIGDLDTADAACRGIAATAGVIVVSVDYRLAPEHPFPAAVDDSYAALEWVAAHMAELGGNGRLAVGGESAGGNLAAVVCQRARDEDGPRVHFQLLLYPVTDCDLDRPSYVANGEGYLLTTDTMRWFWDLYCSDPKRRESPLASPLRAELLAGLPPALVVTAEYDPLRDEGAAYAAALNKAGGHADWVDYPGLVHDFLASAQAFPSSRAAFEETCAALRAALA
jgi:acetyl esterase